MCAVICPGIKQRVRDVFSVPSTNERNCRYPSSPFSLLPGALFQMFLSTLVVLLLLRNTIDAIPCGWAAYSLLTKDSCDRWVPTLQWFQFFSMSSLTTEIISPFYSPSSVCFCYILGAYNRTNLDIAELESKEYFSSCFIILPLHIDRSSPAQFLTILYFSSRRIYRKLPMCTWQVLGICKSLKREGIQHLSKERDKAC